MKTRLHFTPGPKNIAVLVNKTNLGHKLFLVCLSISTSFGRLCAHHQEKQLCLCDTCYLLFCLDDCLVCRSMCSCIPDSHPQEKQLYLCDTCYLLCCVDDCLVCMCICSCISDSHPQEKQLYLCDTCYLLFCVDDCLVCMSICSCIPDSHPHRITIPSVV